MGAATPDYPLDPIYPSHQGGEPRVIRRFHDWRERHIEKDYIYLKCRSIVPDTRTMRAAADSCTAEYVPLSWAGSLAPVARWVSAHRALDDLLVDTLREIRAIGDRTRSQLPPTP